MADVSMPPWARWGERVPKGGTSCANCEYYADNMTCRNADFIAWNGSSTIPGDSPDEYCSIWWSDGSNKTES